MLYRYGVCKILDMFIYYLYFRFLYFQGVFNKTINPLVLFGYDMVIATSYPMRSCGILVIVITLKVWYNLMTWYINSICWHQRSKYLDTNKAYCNFIFHKLLCHSFIHIMTMSQRE